MKKFPKKNKLIGKIRVLCMYLLLNSWHFLWNNFNDISLEIMKIAPVLPSCFGASRFLLKPEKMSVRMEELSLTLDFCRVIWRIKLQRRTTLCNLFSFFLLNNTLAAFSWSIQIISRLIIQITATYNPSKMYLIL